jgi:hypothetical protein
LSYGTALSSDVAVWRNLLFIRSVYERDNQCESSLKITVFCDTVQSGRSLSTSQRDVLKDLPDYTALPDLVMKRIGAIPGLGRNHGAGLLP